MNKTHLPNRSVEATYTAAECARRTGLTVKALRVYEREGLLKPKRMQNAWRVYDTADMARLGEVIALRSLGLKLSDIANLLKGKTGDISHMLELQQQDLLRRKQDIDGGLSRLSSLRSRTLAGEVLTLQEIATIIRETNMTQTVSDVVAWKRYEQMRPRTAVPIDPGNAEQCSGYYQFDGGPIIHVFTMQNKLLTRVQGQSEVEVFAEEKDRYFSSAVRAQFVFERDAAGRVNALILHQGGFEHLAPRLSSEAAAAIMRKLDERISSHTPAAESQAILEAIVIGQIKGEPPYHLMAAPLAEIVKEQNEMFTRDLQQLGAFVKTEFMAVNDEGWDCYRVTFANGELDSSLILDGDGKVSGAFHQEPRTDAFWQRLRSKRH